MSKPKRFFPHVRGTDWYEQRLEGVISTKSAGVVGVLQSIREHHPRFASVTDEEIRAAVFNEDDAKLVLAREHGFVGWQEFLDRVRAIERCEIFEPFTAAFDAVQTGDVGAMRGLLKQQPDLINTQGTNGSSLLNLSVSLRQPAICRLLLDSGAEVDLATTRGVTPLHAAAFGNQPKLIQMLLDAGASPQACAEADGGTPLMVALFGGHDDARKILAAHGVVPQNLRVAAGVGNVDLLRACFKADGSLTENARAHRAFYRPHIGFPLWNPGDSTKEILDEALTYASRNGQPEAMEFLLQHGADIDGDPYRGTALIWTVATGRIDVVRWLLDHGANPSRRATFGGPRHGQGITAMHLATENNRLEIVQLLIARGADPDIKDDNYDATPLGWARHFEHKALVAYLEPLTKAC